MDMRWMTKGRGDTEYIQGVFDFVSFVKQNTDNSFCYCLCKRCRNGRRLTIIEVEDHLFANGIYPGYTEWVHHGEERPASSRGHDPFDELSGAYYGDPSVMNILNDAFWISQAVVENYEQDYSSVPAIADVDDAPVDLEMENEIVAITNCVKYIRSSASRLDRFREYAVEEQCRLNANIPLDVSTRWNSTFLMLEAALKFEHVFGRMKYEDAAFKAYFVDRVGPPQSEDWRNVEAFCLFLKKFYDATEHLSAWKTCTTNRLFVELITLQTEINRACASVDLCLKRVGACMKEKFDKYWGSIEDMNQIIMIVNVLDPRYKLEWGQVALMKVNAKPEVIDSYESVLKAALMKMYQVYKSKSGSNAMEDDAVFDLDNEEFAGLDEISREILRNNMSSQSVIIRNEVDQYLNDTFQLSTLNYKSFDIAKWWRLNESVYPVFSRLAKDIFAIPCSIVASENAFSLGSRVVDPFRAALTSTMVEALVCTTDWLIADPVNLYKEPTEDELAFYKELENMEKEMAGLKNAASTQPGVSGGGSLESGGEQQR